MTLTFNRDFDAPYGVLLPVAPGIRRLLAHNPSAFTFKGTGVYVVGEGKVAVLDPGPDDVEHLAALKGALAHETVTHILITHTHLDHSPAAKHVREWTGAKTYGFGPHGSGKPDEVVEEGGDHDFVPDVRLRDGDVIEVAGMAFTAVHTPGHTSNHICYALKDRGLFSGDHVMGWSTTVVAPPDGDMTDYLASMHKMLAREDAVYWPTHGAPIFEPKRVVTSYIEHRLEREAQILACLARGIGTVSGMVAEMYAGLDPRLTRAAGASVMSHLVKLVREGRVVAAPAVHISAHYSLRT